jgi:hypothetical protein
LLGKNPDMIPIATYNFSPEQATIVHTNESTIPKNTMPMPTTFDDPELDLLMLQIDESQFRYDLNTIPVMSEEEKFDQLLLQIDESQFQRQANNSAYHSSFTRQYEAIKMKAEKLKERKRMNKSAVEPKTDLSFKKKKL